MSFFQIVRYLECKSRYLQAIKDLRIELNTSIFLNGMMFHIILLYTDLK